MKRTGRAARWRRTALLGLLLVGGTAGAHEGGEGPGTGVGEGPGTEDQQLVGELGPLIPWHKDGIHMSLVWPKKGSPQLCFWMRPSEWRGTDLIDPTVLPLGQKRDTFRELVYGGYSFSATLEDSVLTRINADLYRENTLCADIPGAFRNLGKYDVSELTEEDFAYNAEFFHDAGHSRGLNYNLFCGGNVMLADGRIAVIGGHDKAGNHGIRKINIYDPETQTWAPRPVPQAMAEFLADPTGTQFPHVMAGPEPDRWNELYVDPPHPSDMKYQRWYPTAVTLPNGQVLILSGTDQDSMAGPDGADATKERLTAPEVYDPVTDRNTALDNARKLQNMYPRTFVVQTGRGQNDWKVLSLAEAQAPFPEGEDLESYDPWDYNGNTYFFDVQAALADPNKNDPVCQANCQHDCPAQCTRHWQLATPTPALSAHDSGAAVNLRFLDGAGMAASQKIIAFGGSGASGDTDIVEALDFTLDEQGVLTHSGWYQPTDGTGAVARLPMALDQNNAVVLPDGNVLVVGGAGGSFRARVHNLDVQMFKPATGEMITVAKMNVPRFDHSTVTLLPDGSVLIAGGNRVEVYPPNRDVGVPNGQIYYPPYFFKGERPEILQAEMRMQYGMPFNVTVDREISQVAMLRMGPTTHNWAWGNDYVRLPFEQQGNSLKIQTPAVPAAALPGIYMLFVLDSHGVPSTAHRLEVGPSNGNRNGNGTR